MNNNSIRKCIGLGRSKSKFLSRKNSEQTNGNLRRRLTCLTWEVRIGWLRALGIARYQQKARTFNRHLVGKKKSIFFSASFSK